MNDDDKKIDKLSSDISDGKNINWNDYDNKENNSLIDKLGAINDIANFFKNTHPDEISDDSCHNFLFEWGHLQLKELIGEGSYGEVYKAYDSVLDRNVALKLIKEKNISPYQSRAFIQEAKNLARVRNRHVLAIHGVNVNESRVGIWSDLIKGKNLSNLHDKNYRYNFNELLHISQSITEALIAVHESGLIHGDIKAANVMQDENGKIILMDFGTGSESNNFLDNAGYITGTPMLMAPELLAGKGKSQSCDIYSFGVLLFKLATGSYPIKGLNLADIHKAHKNRNYLNFRDFDAKLPRNIQNLILQMISIHPANRPTAVELKQKIKHIINAPQRRLKRMVISFITSLLLIGTIISSMGFYKANQAKTVAVQEKNKAQAVSMFLEDLLASPATIGTGREVKVVDLLEIAAKDINSNLTLSPEARASIYYSLGRSYITLKIPEKAKLQLQESLKINQQLYGEASIESLQVMVKLITANQLLNEDEVSLALMKKLISLAESNGLENSYHAKVARIKLVQHKSKNGNHKSGLAELNKIIDKANNKNDVKYQALLVKSYIYQNQSKYQLALDYGQQASDWLKDNSPNSVSQIEVNTSLIMSFIKLGQMDYAKSLLLNNIETIKRVSGDQNIGYLRTIGNYGAFLIENNNQKEASIVLKEALELSTKLKGNRNPDTISIKINSANNLVALGRLTEGEKLMQSALTDGIIALGENNVSVLILEYNLSELLNNTNRHIEAEKLARSNHKKMLKVFGDQHLYTLLSQDNIANSLNSQKKLSQAEIIYIKLLAILEETQTIQSPYTQLVLSHYVDNLILSKNVKLAKQKLVQLHQIQVEILGQNHSETQKSQKLLKTL